MSIVMARARNGLQNDIVPVPLPVQCQGTSSVPLQVRLQRESNLVPLYQTPIFSKNPSHTAKHRVRPTVAVWKGARSAHWAPTLFLGAFSFFTHLNFFFFAFLLARGGPGQTCTFTLLTLFLLLDLGGAPPTTKTVENTVPSWLTCPQWIP